MGNFSGPKEGICTNKITTPGGAEPDTPRLTVGFTDHCLGPMKLNTDSYGHSNPVTLELPKLVNQQCKSYFCRLFLFQ